MRVYLFGVPGDRRFLEEFDARLGLISRILEERGHEVFNAFGVFKKDGHGSLPSENVKIGSGNFRDHYDRLVVEMSTEINPHATVSWLSELVDDIPTLVLCPKFFEKEISHAANGGIEFLRQFMVRRGQRFFIFYEYSSEPRRYNDEINDQLKQYLEDLCREGISGEHEVAVLAGIGAERRV